MSNEYFYKLGDIVDTKSGSLKIIELIRIYDGNSNRRAYKYECLNCGNISQMIEPSLLKGCGCNVCCKTPKKVLKGINDIETTSSWMKKYFIDKEDANRYTNNSSKRLNFKCPNCGYIKNMKINNLFSKGFCCPQCGDGKSYPEKFMTNILVQLNLNFITQYSPKWGKPKKYDFYINTYNMIIETNGLQHYSTVKLWKDSKEQQSNDKLKKEMALKNDIKYYITIDCSKSEPEFIKNNILHSELAKLFDLSKIDWLKCHEYACNSLIKVACDIFNIGITNTVEIAKIMNMERSTIYKYLKMGNLINWCKYDKEFISISNSKKSKNKANKVLCLDNNMIFNSCNDVENKSENIFGIILKSKSVSRVCRGERPHYKGYHFKFIKNNN